jgi:eukaryotic-like serine/threonine-protein kinase
MQPRFAEEETTDPAMFAFGTVCELARTYGGRYRVEELLGKGGIGEVYAAIDLETQREVAFKVLLHRHQEDRAMVHRFRNEGRIGLRLRHENIVPVHAMGHDEACGPFIVMDRLVGATLAQLCASLGQWPLEQALLTAICIADVVEGLHQTRIPLPDGTVTGIIHRDLKPDNIFMVRQGDKAPRPVLLDFGLAKLVGDLMAGSANTSEGTRVGTARYMSPEQARGDVLTPATDIYSLGIIVYEM